MIGKRPPKVLPHCCLSQLEMVPNGGSIQGPLPVWAIRRNYAMTIEIRADNLAKQGLIMVMTGDGKGKTTAAFGQALRSFGPWLPGMHHTIHERPALWRSAGHSEILPDIDLYQYGLDSFVMRQSGAGRCGACQARLGESKRVIASGKYDMIILDEINVAMDFKLIPKMMCWLCWRTSQPRWTSFLREDMLPKNSEIADMVSEVREIKHHYSAGVRNQAGIEY